MNDCYNGIDDIATDMNKYYSNTDDIDMNEFYSVIDDSDMNECNNDNDDIDTHMNDLQQY